MVERWRNPYSHRGLKKGHGATAYLHAFGIGAVPVGMSSMRDSPHFSLLPASESDITEVLALLDSIDDWLNTARPYAVKWISAGLEVRFDVEFRRELRRAMRSDAEFWRYLNYTDHVMETAINMDF